MTPAWILDVFAAIMLVVAAVSAARLALGSEASGCALGGGQRGQGRLARSGERAGAARRRQTSGAIPPNACGLDRDWWPAWTVPMSASRSLGAHVHPSRRALEPR